jgi:hypothetical protein
LYSSASQFLRIQLKGIRSQAERRPLLKGYNKAKRTKPRPTGRTTLSKSSRGKASKTIPEAATAKTTGIGAPLRYTIIKIAVKAVREPIKVFPPVKGMMTLPKIFPITEENPSAKAKARIAMVATGNGKRKRENMAPRARVTGPITRWPSSLFREAISVKAVIKGTLCPASLVFSAIK